MIQLTFEYSNRTHDPLKWNISGSICRCRAVVGPPAPDELMLRHELRCVEQLQSASCTV